MPSAPGASRSALRQRAERPRPGDGPPSVAQRDARAGRWTGPPAARHPTGADGRAVRGILDRLQARRLVAGKVGNGFLRAVIVDERLAGSGRGNECGDGGIVQCARETEATFVPPSDRIVGKLSRVLDYAEQSAPLLLGRVRLSW